MGGERTIRRLKRNFQNVFFSKIRECNRERERMRERFVECKGDKFEAFSRQRESEETVREEERGDVCSTT